MIIRKKERLAVCDIWRIRNPIAKQYTFRRQHYFGFIQRRLDYAFASKNLQETVKDTEILNAFSSDRSLAFCSVRKGLWKSYNSLNEIKLKRFFQEF